MLKNINQIIYFIIIFIIALVCGSFSFFLHNHTIDFSSLQQDMQAKPTILLDCHGDVWGQFALDKREFVLLESMPEHLINAFLIIEDQYFFQHPGISFRGILRSMVVNLWSGKKMQGASTITQQLVRLLFLTAKKTFARKLKEQWYAILLERSCSKEQILESYLNNVYFGYGIYGVQAAAQRFWGIDIDQVSVDQACVLASIMKSPQMYSPIHATERVKKRRNYILKRMQQAGMISKNMYDQALQKPVEVRPPSDFEGIAPHLKETIRIFMEQLVGKHALYTQGFTIQTTLDIAMQKEAEKSFSNHVKILRQTLKEPVDGGMIAMESKTGQIRSLIGGYDFKKSKFNRALQAYRQIGSIFKILVYAVALQKGLKLSDLEIDEPFELVSNGVLWAPKNYDDQFRGIMTRAYALSHSNNIVTIKTLLQTGIQPVIDLANRCGIESSMKPYPSLALGCVDVTVLQATAAFNVIVNHGCFVPAHFLLWVKNSSGKKIFKQQVIEKQVIESSIADSIAHVLTFSIERLKRYYTKVPWNIGPALGKTGTTNDSRICWFAGATPELTTVICVGCDQNQSMGRNVFGSQTAFPIWFNFYNNIAKSDSNFYVDPALQSKFIHLKTGKICKYDSGGEVALLYE